MQQSRSVVVHVAANHEKQAARHFPVRDVEHYLPLYCERSRRSDRAMQLELPLFPGYIFCSLFAECEANRHLDTRSRPRVGRQLSTYGERARTRGHLNHGSAACSDDASIYVCA